MGWLDWMFSKLFKHELHTIRPVNRLDAQSLVGLWEQVGYVLSASEKAIPWPADSLNASIREFFWFAADGVVMFGRFGADASVSFDEARRVFVCDEFIDKILTGNYRLDSSALIEEWITSDGTTDVHRVELTQLSADQFVVRKEAPHADVQLLVAYRRAPLKAMGHSPKRRPPQRQIQWEMATKSDQVGDYFITYKAMVNGAKWLIAMNEFPAEILYTLIVDGKEVRGFNEWPKNWVRPEPGQSDSGST